VGGDFYDYYHFVSDSQNPSEDFAVAVGDVSGKGTPAALYMAVSSSALAAKAPFVPDVGQLCDQLNTILYPRVALTRMNIALLYVYFTKHECQWTARVANAGLIAPLLRRNGHCEYLDVGGLPLGVQSDTRYHQIELPLQRGDWLVLCSDGIVEAMNAAREMYGFDRLQQRVLAAPTTRARELIDWIMADITTFIGGAEPHDDMTIVVVRLKVETE
jgi:serine phosphatase RsbU (regulator of sigma subunit)